MTNTVKPKWHYAESNDNFRKRGAYKPTSFQTKNNGNRMDYPVREILQNSSDAANGKPVHVRLSEQFIPDPMNHEVFRQLSEEFNALERYEKEANKKKNKDNLAKNENEDVKNFLNRARNAFKKNSPYSFAGSAHPGLRVFCAEDFNTKGMRGAESGKITGDFDAFVFAEGITTKTNAEDGGSRGEGKSSFYNISDIQTIFVATKTEDGEAFAGINEMATRKTGDGKTYDSAGNYIKTIKNENGELEPHAIHLKDNDSIYELFKRDEIGTTIVIPGFNVEPDIWQKEAVQSVLTNFMAPILNGELTVEIVKPFGKPIEINAETAKNVIEEYIKKDKNQKNRDLVVNQYNALTKGTVIPLSVLEENDAELHLYIDKETNNHYIVSRNIGMLVENSHLKTDRNFTAYVRCYGTKLNELLRISEDGRHLKWDESNVREEGKRAEVRATIDKLEKTIKDTIRKLTETQKGNSVEAYGLDKVIPFDDGNNKSNAPDYIPYISERKNFDKRKGTFSTENDDENPQDKTWTDRKQQKEQKKKKQTSQLPFFGATAEETEDTKKKRKQRPEFNVETICGGNSETIQVELPVSDSDMDEHYLYFQFASERYITPKIKGKDSFNLSAKIIDAEQTNGIPNADAKPMEIDYALKDCFSKPRYIYGPITKPAGCIASFIVTIDNPLSLPVYSCLLKIENISQYKEMKK